jgi:hypothetical protein
LPLKMKSFLSIQMLQLNRMIISMKRLTPSCTLNDSRVSKRGPRVGFRLRRPQAFCAKEHSMNKCSRVSSTCKEQRTHSKEGRAIFFRLNMFLVLSLSCKSNQKKTLCLF